ncbi:hypothetical protein CsSME_00039521 [Camellia sinensis var. sinensis]
MHCGRGRPQKKPDNPSSKSLSSVILQPIAKKSRGRPPKKPIDHNHQPPHLSFHSQSVTQNPKIKTVLNVPSSFDVLDATPSPLDDEKFKKFPYWNDKRKRKDRKRREEINPPPTLENRSTQSRLPEIPGPIPHNILEIALDYANLSIFFKDIPDLDD